MSRLPDVSIRSCQPPPRLQQYDRADAGVLVLHKIEACVREKLLQPDWPLIKGDGIQKAGRHIAINVVAAIADNVQRALGSMDDRASTIEHEAVLVCPQRSLGEKVT